MALFDKNGFSLFGLQISKAQKQDEDKSAAISLPIDDDGSNIVQAAASAAYYGIYYDTNALTKDDIALIQKCREIALYPEIDIAIQDIVNEAIPQETETPLVELNLHDVDLSDELKEEFQDEFKRVLQLLKYEELASDIFKRWYIDGRLFYQIIVDKKNLKRGIAEMRLIEATKIRKIKEVKKEKSKEFGVDVVTDVQEYYIYQEAGFAPPAQQSAASSTSASTSTQGVRLSPDSVVYVASGWTDQNTNNVLSYLTKAIRPANQLRMLEDANVVYFIARAPERRIFYVDVGNLPKGKAEQYLKDIMNKFRNKIVYDSKTGSVKDDKRVMSMMEDLWMPRRDGNKGTEISTLPGAQNLSSQLESLEYFQKKLYQSLNIPVGRLQPEQGFSLGRSTEISRDELKFQKFIDKLRRKFSQLLLDTFKTQLVLKGICNHLEWEELKENIRIDFQKDNAFNELKEVELLQSRMSMIPQVDPYLGKFFSKEWVQRNVLRFSDDEIEQMNDEIAAEKGDPTAQPSMPGGMGMGGDPSMMGGDPNMLGGQPPMGDDGQGDDPFAQPSPDEDEEDQQFPFPKN
jgi:hypothetical protein